MQALDAALAFGITMLVLAMVVTTIVETMHRTLGLREKGLALLLGSFYDRILASRANGAFRDADGRRAFIEMMTVNRGPVGGAPLTALRRTLHLDTQSEDRKFLSWIWGGRRLGSLGLMNFMERLGGSEYGVALMAEAGSAGQQGVEWMLKDVAQKFDAFGHEASEYFEARARLLSVLTGFVLAFAINVNALVLFDTFMRRPDVTQAVIAKGQEVTEKYETLQQNVTALNASAATAAGVANAAPANAASQQALAESVQKAASDADAAVRDLHTVGVPIGWTTESWAALKAGDVRALLGILLGGLLIGLGAPFWYSTVQALTGVRRMARGDKETPQAATAAAPQPATGPTDLPGTPIEAFHAALGARFAAGEVRAFEEAVG